MRPKALLSWSTGKDSAFALHEVRTRGDVEVVGLLTTVTTEFARVSMHGVRESLLELQIEQVGLPCRKVGIPSPCPNEVYEREMTRVLSEARADGISHVAFGDLFLEDIRAYREARLAAVGFTGVFPLWQRDTPALAQEMLRAGLVATTTCVDLRKLPATFVGRTFDAHFLADLPAGIDPCGEHGEFHTFVTAGPMFHGAIAVRVGETVERDGFAFADLLPEPGG